MTIRVGVIGCGHFGRFHTQKYDASQHAALVGVVDFNPDARARLASETGCPGLPDLDSLLDLGIDAASVVVPTHAHHDVAARLLEAGVHVLVEKPLAATLAEAEDLIARADAARRVLQVGHLERFNPAIAALEDVIGTPMFIESHRIAPYKPRGTDVDVILDLMIHDIDLIQHLIQRPVQTVDSVGVPVLSDKDDIANARLHFEGGCVVNVTASRVSLKSERKMRLFQRDAYISIDFQAREAAVARKGAGELFPGIPNFEVEHRTFAANDALALEIEAFLAAIRGEREIAVTGRDGLRALATALKITQSLQRPA